MTESALPKKGVNDAKMMHVCFIIPFRKEKTESEGQERYEKRKSPGGKKKRLLNAAAFGFITIALVLVCGVMILWTDVYVSTDPEKEKADNGSAEKRGGRGDELDDTEANCCNLVKNTAGKQGMP